MLSLMKHDYVFPLSYVLGKKTSFILPFHYRHFWKTRVRASKYIIPTFLQHKIKKGLQVRQLKNHHSQRINRPKCLLFGIYTIEQVKQLVASGKVAERHMQSANKL